MSVPFICINVIWSPLIVKFNQFPYPSFCRKLTRCYIHSI